MYFDDAGFYEENTLPKMTKLKYNCGTKVEDEKEIFLDEEEIKYFNFLLAQLYIAESKLDISETIISE